MCSTLIEMFRRSIGSRCRPAMVGGMVVLTTMTVEAQCLRYSIDLIQPQSCGFFNPGMSVSGISESGEMSGSGGTCGKFESAGFAWYGTMPLYYLPMPQGLAGAPTDINSARQMSGYLGTPDGGGNYHAFYHHNGITFDLGWPAGGNFSIGSAINEAGTICGTWGNNWFGNPGLAAFTWHNGVFGHPALPLGPNSQATDIANDSTICGWMGPGNSVIDSHAFIHQPDGTVIDLGTVFDGAIGAVARSINNSTSVTGTWQTEVAPLLYRWGGFYWNEGVAQELGLLPGFVNCLPNSINDHDTIVGYCTGDSAGSRAFVWQAGIMYALQDLVPPEYNLQITNATAINNAGQIAAYGLLPPNQAGIIYVAMRLNPIPPLPGDITCDWKVNVPDLLAVLNAWRPCPPPPAGEPFTKNCHADLNDDGVVALDDLLAVVLNWAP